jgi:hypothetical protein
MNVAKLKNLSQELDYQKKTFGGLQHRAALGVTSYQAACRKYAGIDLNINKVEHNWSYSSCCAIHIDPSRTYARRIRICTFPLPILHSNE